MHLFFNFALLSRLMIDTMQNMGTRKWKPKIGEGMGGKKYLFWISSYPGSVKLQVNGLECLSVTSEELWKTGRYGKAEDKKTLP